MVKSEEMATITITKIFLYCNAPKIKYHLLIKPTVPETQSNLIMK